MKEGGKGGEEANEEVKRKKQGYEKSDEGMIIYIGRNRE